jgi:hypothetical protein
VRRCNNALTLSLTLSHTLSHALSHALSLLHTLSPTHSHTYTLALSVGSFTGEVQSVFVDTLSAALEAAMVNASKSGGYNPTTAAGELHVLVKVFGVAAAASSTETHATGNAVADRALAVGTAGDDEVGTAGDDAVGTAGDDAVGTAGDDEVLVSFGAAVSYVHAKMKAPEEPVETCVDDAAGYLVALGTSCTR